jgi:thymidine phosphorylase
MLAAAGIDVDPAGALADGRAMDAWRRMIAAQGGDPDAALATAASVHEVRAERSGVLTRLDALAVGTAAWRLGAGRARKEDAVSPAAGVVMLAKPGDSVQAGQPLLQLHADDESRIPRALAALDNGIDIGMTTRPSRWSSTASPAESHMARQVVVAAGRLQRWIDGFSEPARRRHHRRVAH